MRILHVTTFLQGGAGRVIALLAVAQHAAGHDVTVVADDGAAPGYGSYPEYLEQLAHAGIAVHGVASTFRRDVALNAAVADAVHALAVAAPPQVVHTHAAVPTLVATAARAGARWPIVQTMHGWGIHKTAAQVQSDLTALAGADAVVTPSSAARAMLGELGLTRPIEVIPYGIATGAGDAAGRAGLDHASAIDLDDRPLFAQLRGDKGAVVLCVGTIGARKQQTLLVDALVGCPDVTAVFIGDGDRDGLRAYAVQRGVDRRVHVLGYRTHASRYLSQADALVLPSRNEGLPIAVLEALRAGVPVVASAIPEIAEAIDDTTGCLFEPGDAGALAHALRNALDPRTRPARQAAARVAFAARYALDGMTRAYELLYRAAAAAR